MKVKQLIKKLKKLDQNAEVIMSSDAEGNSFSFLYEVDEDFGQFYEDDQWPYIQFYEQEDLNELESEEQKKIKGKLKRGIVLWPR